MKTLKNDYRIEKMMKVISIISGVAVITGIIAGVLYLIFEKSYLDTVACYGLTLFVLPVLAIQIAMSANIGQYGTKGMGGWSWLFILIMFPFADAWFLAGINALYHFFPNYHLIVDKVLKEETRISSDHQFWLGVVIIYFSLIIIGFIIRIIKEKKNKIILA
jgi:hypothetical protein